MDSVWRARVQLLVENLVALSLVGAVFWLITELTPLDLNPILLFIFAPAILAFLPQSILQRLSLHRAARTLGMEASEADDYQGTARGFAFSLVWNPSRVLTFPVVTVKGIRPFGDMKLYGGRLTDMHPHVVTGAPDVDRRVRFAEPKALWLARMTPEARGLLPAFSTDWSIEKDVLTVALSSRRTEGMVREIQQVLAFADALRGTGEGLVAGLIHAARTDPLPLIRRQALDEVLEMHQLPDHRLEGTFLELAESALEDSASEVEVVAARHLRRADRLAALARDEAVPEGVAAEACAALSDTSEPETRRDTVRALLGEASGARLLAVLPHLKSDDLDALRPELFAAQERLANAPSADLRHALGRLVDAARHRALAAGHEVGGLALAETEPEQGALTLLSEPIGDRQADVALPEAGAAEGVS